MQLQEDHPQQYVDTARVTDNKMRPCAVASRPRPLLAPMGAQRPKAVAQRPVPPGCGQEGTRRAEQCLRPWA